MFENRLFYIGIVFVLLSFINISVGTNLNASEKEIQEYKQEFSNISNPSPEQKEIKKQLDIITQKLAQADN